MDDFSMGLLHEDSCRPGPGVIAAIRAPGSASRFSPGTADAAGNGTV